MAAALIVCADDYGAHPGSSGVIADLIRGGFLNAAGAVTEAEGWAKAAPRLRALADSRPDLAVGLHVALTDRPMEVVRACFVAPPHQATIERVRRQLGRFTEAMGRLPHFVDGHHHVHLAPAVREVLFEALRETGFSGWLRQCAARGGPPGAKRLFLAAMSQRFARAAAAAGWALNPGFGGLRRFSPAEDIAALWRRDVAAMRRGGGLLMVHPGAANDHHGACRAQEAALIGGGLVVRLAAEAGLTLAIDPRRPWEI